MPQRVRLALAAVALTLGACQMSVGIDVAVDRSGGGEIELALALDRELTEMLQDGGVDLRAGLEDTMAAAPDWDIVVGEAADGGLQLSASTAFDDPDDFARVTDDLHAALDEDDARLFRRLRLERADDGAITFRGELGLELPAAPGARGVGVAFDADDLERLLAERGDELIRYDLRVTFPAAPDDATHDADEVDGNSLTWRVPVGAQRMIEATSLPPPRPQWVLLVAIALVAAAASAVIVVLLRVRARRR